MSGLVKLPEVVAKIRPLHPKVPWKIDAALKVAPRTKRYMLVGTAFDYLLRFEIQRRAPHAKASTWVAALAPGRVWQPGLYLHLPPGVGPDEGAPPEAMEAAARRFAGRMRAVVEKAEATVAAYLESKSPTPAEQADLATHAIRLAKLDDLPRALMQRDIRLDLLFEEADPEDVQDLLSLLAVVPWGQLLHDKVLLLNPTFTDPLVGMSDTDLISGDTLMDFKTTKAGEVTPAIRDQLLGYLLLARNRRRADPTFLEVNRLAVYFCRHGHVWVQEASLWTRHPDFADLEKWFFDYAKELHDRSKQSRGIRGQ